MKDILRDRNKFWGIFCIIATVVLIGGWFVMPLKYDFWILLVTVILAAGIAQFSLYKIWIGVTVCAAGIYIVNQKAVGLPYIAWWVLIFAAVLLGAGLMLLQSKAFNDGKSRGAQTVGVINSDGIAKNK